VKLIPCHIVFLFYLMELKKVYDAQGFELCVAEQARLSDFFLLPRCRPFALLHGLCGKVYVLPMRGIYRDTGQS